MKLDNHDVAILRVLLEDGRASLRQIARKTSLTTPTVSAHLSKIMKAGMIRKFVPLFNPEVTQQGIIAFATLKVHTSELNKVARKLAKMEEILGVFATTGENSLMLKVHSDDAQGLQRFLTGKLALSLKGEGEVVGNQIVTNIVKDEQPAPNFIGIEVSLRCDFCKGPISTNRPYNIKVGTSSYYFCCKTCRRSYLDKHRSRLEAAKSREKLSKMH